MEHAPSSSRTTLEEDYNALCIFAIQHFPTGKIITGEDAYAIAILSHGKNGVLDASADHEDLSWFKVKAKHSVSKINGAYEKKTGVTVCLKQVGVSKDDTTQMRDLRSFGKNTIVLTAHEESSPSATSSQTRNPLQPINIQLLDNSNSLFTGDTKPLIKNEQPQEIGMPQNRSGSSSQHPSVLEAPARESVKAEPQVDTPMPDAEPSNPASNQSNQNNRLQKLIQEASPEALEKEVRSSQIFLESLRQPLQAKSDLSEDAKHWFTQISNLQRHVVNTPTIIGVVGNTGAGKSSVINAMLDEERLVPTNCMRACTAVVTEISYNSSEGHSSKYRGEIEFIQPADWEKDLRVSLAELKDDNGGISRDIYQADSEAAIAYAKVRAVYPHLSKEDLAASSIERLMRDQAVKNVLGTTKKVAKSQPDVFYKALQYYVDSKEKSTETKKAKKDKAEPKQMEFWPLIKVVRIYTKADALSTGAIVVDLPGVHDSNAARAAVAAGYLKQCTGLWIVAPIGRAVDDKSAKTLLGESFKRQLRYDGTYSRVTFICSKTDDISITEAADSLGLEEEMASDWEKMDSIDKELSSLKQKLKDFAESKAVYRDVLNDAEDAIEAWEKLQEQAESGETVWAPTDSSKKRKRSVESKRSRKKSRGSNASASGDDDDSIEDDDENVDEDESDNEDNASEKGDPLTMEEIETQIEHFKDDKRKARRERVAIDTQVKDLKKEIADLNTSRNNIETAMSSVCIESRNNYAKGAIQTDFAAGIKELDQENAQEEDEANFNPDEDIRDYEEVARSLKVFCVSSRAYQKLDGRLTRDSNVPGFLTKEATEIPALQAHCKKLTEAGRASNCRRFLTDLSQLLNSLGLWSIDDGTGLKISSKQLEAETHLLKKRLATLEGSLERTVKETLDEMNLTLAENIFDNFELVVNQAVQEATSTATRWGDRHSGGFYWATYKALCRRNGVFTNAKGPHDLNAQLIEPVIKGLASNWEKAFARRLPSVLQGFSRKSKNLLLAFHKEIEARCMKQGAGVAGLAMLEHQLRNYEGIFVNLTHEMVEVINNLQREANREFTPVVADTLASAYEFCAAEVGTGQYLRMKHHMTSHVDTQRTAMFHRSTQEVKGRLVTMCRSVEERMANKADEVWSAMNRDYTQVVSGKQLPQGQQMPKWERLLRGEIGQIIEDRAKAIENEKENEAKDEAKDDVNAHDVKPDAKEGDAKTEDF